MRDEHMYTQRTRSMKLSGSLSSLTQARLELPRRELFFCFPTSIVYGWTNCCFCERPISSVGRSEKNEGFCIIFSTNCNGHLACTVSKCLLCFATIPIRKTSDEMMVCVRHFFVFEPIFGGIQLAHAHSGSAHTAYTHTLAHSTRCLNAKASRMLRDYETTSLDVHSSCSTMSPPDSPRSFHKLNCCHSMQCECMCCVYSCV